MATNDTSKVTEELRDDLEKIKSDLAALVDTVGKFAADGGREGLHAFETVRARAEAQAAHSIESVERQIVEKPLISVLIAFAAGMLFGRLMDRR